MTEQDPLLIGCCDACTQARDRALHAEQQLRLRDKELGKLGKVLDHSKATEHETSAQRMVSEEEKGRLDGEAAQVRGCWWVGGWR